MAKFPTGKAWIAAQKESNWLIFAVFEPDENGKRGKFPVIAGKPWMSADVRQIRMTYQAAADRIEQLHGSEVHMAKYRKRFAEREKPPKTAFSHFCLGYHPRDGSAMIVIDLDNCRDPKTGDLKKWCKKLLNGYSGYMEVSSSQTGLRLLMPRAEGDGKNNCGEGRDVGLFARMGRGAILTGDLVTGADRGLVRDEGVIKRLLKRKGQKKGRELSGGLHDGSEALSYDMLSLAEVEDALMSIRNEGIDEDTWLAILGPILRTYGEDALEMCEEWTDTQEDCGTYDPEDNQRRLGGLIGSEGGATLGTLIWHAQKAGWVHPRAQEQANAIALKKEQLAGDVPTICEDIADICARYVYDTSREKFIDLKNGNILSVVTVEMSHPYATIISDHKTKPKPLETAVARCAQIKKECHKVERTVFDPRFNTGIIWDHEFKNGMIVAHKGQNLLNTWQGIYCAPEKAEGVDAGRWIEHIENLYPDDAGAIIDWCAWQLQRPGELLGWALVLGGPQGGGKDTIFKPLLFALGSAADGGVDFNRAMSGYDDFLIDRTLLVLQEAFGPSGKAGREIENQLKLMIDPPGRIRMINPKGRGQISIPAIWNMAMTTNYRDGLHLSPDDRRYAVAWTDTKLADWPKGYFKEFYHWLNEEGGNPSVVEYLLTRQLPPMKGVCPLLSGKQMMIDASRSDLEMQIENLTDDLDIVSVKELTELIEGNYTGKKIGAALRDMGWQKVGGQHRKQGNRVKQSLFANGGNHPDLIQAWQEGKAEASLAPPEFDVTDD